MLANADKYVDLERATDYMNHKSKHGRLMNPNSLSYATCFKGHGSGKDGIIRLGGDGSLPGLQHDGGGDPVGEYSRHD